MYSLHESPATSGLDAFAAGSGPAAAARVRSLVHGWQAGGGTFSAGRHAVRLLVQRPTGLPFTAATIHARPIHLELARPILAANGVSEAAWRVWADERPELVPHGFEATQRFPTVPLAPLGDVALLRLAEGLRDLARLAATASGGNNL